MYLMLVESPEKIKKIKSFLGPNWVVKATKGHIRDLPENSIGFDLDGFKPIYETNRDKIKVLNEIQSLVYDADEVYLASDPDREGEAIAYHLECVLKLKKPKRITFNEISEGAIKTAISQVRGIDYNLVRAYEGRRVLDRIIGYYISPILSKKAKITLSAGRVQSVCLKIVVHREREIDKFSPRKYYNLTIELENGLKADLVLKNWTDENHIFDKDIIDKLSTITSVRVSEISEEEKQDYPRPPFISSTLQRAAEKILGFSPKKTMDCAQKLHEAEGAITYHRTDNPNFSESGFESIKKWLKENNLPSSDKPKKYNSKSSAQEAHEAIRPSDISKINVIDDEDSQALYNLIRERAIASAMPPATDSITTCKLNSLDKFEAGGGKSLVEFLAKGIRVVDNSWRDFVELEPKGSEDKLLVGDPKKGDVYKCVSSIIEKKTIAPKKYTQSDLVIALEKLGIGRPSTYATILENIKSRKYISVARGKKGKFLTPLPIGIAVVDALENMSFMNLQYTNIVEAYLDKISKGEGDYKTLVTKVHNTVSEEIKLIKIPTLLKTEPCPKCGCPTKIIKKRGKKPFWVHIENEDSEGCEKYLNDSDGKPQVKAKHITSECPDCGGEIKRLKRKEKNIHFWVHISNEDEIKCRKYISDKDCKPVGLSG